ncbi:hypothetical protein DCAR_0104020 [Daucus carota subsp. sativus]|uniref:CBM-cenC domain-containing protein n=1 Tax=Daucus carota subsp. sativus TaxID=79200 RepID=A0A166IHC0_DAUCS|nr:PREDICTED: uncharacterized protein LOC108214057 [Daucus carota subsp. sativus]WOG84835.1 hypothetical protein DCAR_0104020 [Daucus carota subsp. sativus]
MAQAVKIDAAQAMKMGNKLPHVVGSEEKTKVVPANKLDYADPQAWKFYRDTAEFVGGSDPTVQGVYGVEELDSGKTYEVSFYVSVMNLPVSNPVTLTLELPNRKKQENTVDITVNPLVWQEVSVGKFENKFPYGDIKFKFSGVSGDTWRGLLLKGVHITSSS